MLFKRGSTQDVLFMILTVLAFSIPQNIVLSPNLADEPLPNHITAGQTVSIPDIGQLTQPFQNNAVISPKIVTSRSSASLPGGVISTNQSAAPATLSPFPIPPIGTTIQTPSK